MSEDNEIIKAYKGYYESISKLESIFESKVFKDLKDISVCEFCYIIDDIMPPINLIKEALVEIDKHITDLLDIANAADNGAVDYNELSEAKEWLDNKGEK